MEYYTEAADAYARFLEVAKVQPYRLLQGGQNLPINPFVLPAYDDTLLYDVPPLAARARSPQRSRTARRCRVNMPAACGGHS